jgi:putative transposase
MSKNEFGVAEAYQIPDELWQEIETLLPPLPAKKKSGRPRISDRAAMNAIFYLLRTGAQWDALPRSLGAKSTVHDRYQFWVEADLFLKLWQISLAEYDLQIGVDWEWLAADGAMTKAPLGREKNRAKSDGPGQGRGQTQLAGGRRGLADLGSGRRR